MYVVFQILPAEGLPFIIHTSKSSDSIKVRLVNIDEVNTPSTMSFVLPFESIGYGLFINALGTLKRAVADLDTPNKVEFDTTINAVRHGYKGNVYLETNLVIGTRLNEGAECAQVAFCFTNIFESVHRIMLLNKTDISDTCAGIDEVINYFKNQKAEYLEKVRE